MTLEAALVGEAQHLVVHTGRVSYSEHVDASIHQFFRNPIHRHVALCTHQHLALPHQGFVDGFHQGRGLSSSRRSVNDGNILRPKHLIHSPFLGRIEPRKLHRGKRESARLLMRIEQVAEISQTVVLRFHHSIQSLEHQLVAGFVEGQLYADRLRRLLQIEQRGRIRNGNHHSVTIHIAHGAGEGEIFDLFFTSEEHDGATELKIVLDILIRGTEYLDGCLVQRIIKALSHL